jgi:cyanate permease
MTQEMMFMLVVAVVFAAFNLITIFKAMKPVLKKIGERMRERMSQ